MKYSQKRVTFRIAAYTDAAGKCNESAPKRGNEDDLYVNSDLSGDGQESFIADDPTILSDAGCLMVVADGMGGMNAGEVASAIAIETVREAFENRHITQGVMRDAASRVAYMEKVVTDADAAIKKRSGSDAACEGMGSTIIMAWLYEDKLSVTWCGDSRAYLFREPYGIKQISKDHSYVQSLVDKGDITEVEAFVHPCGNIITRSLGDPEKKAQPDSVTVNVSQGDIILICSDGLSGVLRDRKSYDYNGQILPGENLEDIIRANRQSMGQCRQALWAAAEAADWYDNVTAILCEVMDGGCPSEATETPEGDEETDGGSDFGPRTNSHITIRLKKRVIRRVMLWVAILCTLCLGYLSVTKLLDTGKPDNSLTTGPQNEGTLEGDNPDDGKNQEGTPSGSTGNNTNDVN